MKGNEKISGLGCGDTQRGQDGYFLESHVFQSDNLVARVAAIEGRASSVTKAGRNTQSPAALETSCVRQLHNSIVAKRNLLHVTFCMLGRL
jgi:hypothetical protein